MKLEDTSDTAPKPVGLGWCPFSILVIKRPTLSQYLFPDHPQKDPMRVPSFEQDKNQRKGGGLMGYAIKVASFRTSAHKFGFDWPIKG